ncbi:hypothetical protein E2C01_033468 [Portunus trituberculatus]|uniref:Uncharacterized protein n=1 Tax=Portunus trituberculatus TaxID=210409 RepID=A0A5B7F3I5_PORTR|nr:hypothetical protein [Portunus trituberculatus]
MKRQTTLLNVPFKMTQWILALSTLWVIGTRTERGRAALMNPTGYLGITADWSLSGPILAGTAMRDLDTTFCTICSAASPAANVCLHYLIPIARGNNEISKNI